MAVISGYSERTMFRLLRNLYARLTVESVRRRCCSLASTLDVARWPRGGDGGKARSTADSPGMDGGESDSQDWWRYTGRAPNTGSMTSTALARGANRKGTPG